jgi:endoglucanase
MNFDTKKLHWDLNIGNDIPHLNRKYKNEKLYLFFFLFSIITGVSLVNPIYPQSSPSALKSITTDRGGFAAGKIHHPSLKTLAYAPAKGANKWTGYVLNGTGNYTASNNLQPYSGKDLNADSIAPDHSGMSSLGSVEFSAEMSPGWNIGNSLDAIGGETAWGNPKITQQLIDSVKAAGFKSIRIPVAWSKFTNDSLFIIDTTWLNRVEEVVNYVLKDSMYAIINEHWDGGWQQPTYKDSVYVNNRLAAIWKQIAIRFRDYGDHLLFAGTNEVMVTNNYSTPKKEYYTVQNSFNQTFVNTVRSTGGRNYYRYLLVQGFNTNINYTVSYFAAPADAAPNRLMVEVHYYDPYNFTINTGSGYTTQWGNDAAIKTDTWANESYADNQFQKMKTKFIDKGYAVILGEYGVVVRLNLGSDSLNAVCARYRDYYIKYVTASMFKHGLVPIYWDNGYTGNNGMGILNRASGSKAYPDIIKAIIEGVDSANITGVNHINPEPDQYRLMQNYPNPFNPETKISYNLAKEGAVTLEVFDLLGRREATIINNKIQSSGFHEISFDASGLPSGIYLYKLKSGNFIGTKKMVLLK